MNILKLNGLSKNFGEFKAVKELNLEVKKGETLGLLGPNGAGKTTTISMIATLLDPTGGSIYYKGRNMKKDPRMLQDELGYVPQEIALYEDLSAWDNLMFFGRLYGLKGAELKKRANEVLEMIELKDRKKSLVKHYSGGMKRRLNIGAGLLHDPSIMIMDEPTVGIDPQSRHHILEMIKGLCKEGKTIIYTSHYMEEVEYLCERTVIMDQGRIIASGTKEELLQQQNLGEEVEIKVNPKEKEKIAKLFINEEVLLTIDHKDQELVSVQTIDGTFNSKNIINILINNAITFHSIEIKKPSLESVFLKLTGKNLRD